MNHVAHAPLLFFVLSVLCQAAGFIGAMSVGLLYPPNTPVVISQLITIAVHAGVAFIVARAFLLPRTWQLVNLAIAPAFVISLAVNIPGAALGAIAIVLLIIYIPTFWTRVPYYPTSTEMYDAIVGVLPTDRSFKFIDLGCGFGGMLKFIAKACPSGTFEGVEIGPLPYLLSKLRFIFSRAPVSIRFQNFWRFSFAEYDFVYAFLAPGPMPELWVKVKKEMKPGTIFLTNTFEVEAQAAQVIEVNDRRKTKLYVHRM